MAISISKRVAKRREALRAAGLRPMQIWVPDAGRAGFDDECRRQSLAVAEADRIEPDLTAFMDAALSDLDSSR